MTTPSGSLLLQDFSGGWNNRDSANELAYNETPNAENWTLDQRGGLRVRNGCSLGVALPGDAATEAFLWYSKALDLWFCGRSSAATMHVFTRPGDFSGVWTDRGTINTDVATNVAFADFPGNPPSVVITTDSRTGAVKGTWQYTAAGALIAQAGNQANTSGQSVEVWQNRAWICGYTASDANGNPTRVFYSALGDVSAATGWVAANFNDLKDLNGDPATALAVQGGALMAFKERSAYRINDSATGAYQTIDTQAGCVGGRAVCKAAGRLYTWGADGVYEWTGGPGRMVSEKIQNLVAWASASTTNVCAVYFDQKVYFAAPVYTQGGGGVANLEQVYEYDPGQKWWMRHSVQTNIPGAARITSFAKKNNQLYAAVKNKNNVFSLFDATPGKDDTTSYTATYTMRWLQPNSGMLSRLHRVRIMGFADQNVSASAFSLNAARNWIPTTYITFDLTVPLKSAGLAEDNLTADFQSLGHGTAFQFTFTYFTTAVAVASIRGIQIIDQSLAWPSPGYPHAPGMTGYHRTGTANAPPSPGPGPRP